MKVLFSMRHSGALRNFASTVAELARRGHQVHLVFMMPDKRGDDRLAAELTAAFPTVTSTNAGKTPWRFWLGLARAVRAAADYARYLAPEFAGASALRDRAAERVSPLFRAALARTPLGSGPGLTVVAAVLRAIDRAIPADRAVAALVAAQSPDLVLVTPLVDLGSDQPEYVKAARTLGIPCGLCVHSWDNLTNKGLIHGRPDRVYVWNDAQRREAVDLHRVAPKQVAVTGAPAYDQWFDRRPGSTREAFCLKVGLRADRPFFLYLCSSQFIAPREADFIRKWIAAVRSAPDARVREAGILVRLHPRTHPRRLPPFAFPEWPNVAVWPRGGANPVDEESRRDYFDSMHHAAAAVGINTSAQIEAAIAGRPVFSIRAPEYAATQEGTLHFRYLLTEGGGLLHVADTLEAHVRALAAAVDGDAPYAGRLRGFVEAFERPRGLDVAATPLLADAIEELGALPRLAPERLPAWLYPVRLACYPVGAWMAAVRRFAGPPPRRVRPPAAPGPTRAVRDEPRAGALT